MSNLSLVLIKPDAVEEGVIGEILSIYEKNGLEIINLKWVNADRELLREHYREHVDKPFYDSLETFMRGGPTVAVVLRGENAVEVVRAINGATDPDAAAPNTIRYVFGYDNQHNAVHGSENNDAAKREIDLWF